MSITETCHQKYMWVPMTWTHVSQPWLDKNSNRSIQRDFMLDMDLALCLGTEHRGISWLYVGNSCFVWYNEVLEIKSIGTLGKHVWIECINILLSIILVSDTHWDYGQASLVNGEHGKGSLLWNVLETCYRWFTHGFLLKWYNMYGYSYKILIYVFVLYHGQFYSCSRWTKIWYYMYIRSSVWDNACWKIT